MIVDSGDGSKSPSNVGLRLHRMDLDRSADVTVGRSSAAPRGKIRFLQPVHCRRTATNRFDTVYRAMKGNQNSNIILFASGLVFGAISWLLVSQLFQTNPRNVTPDAFFLGVKVIFPNEVDKSAFESEFEKLAAFVRTSEPGTISYELLRSDKQPLQVYILERYRTKSDYLDVHKKSKPFLEFREKFQRMIERGAVVDGDSYLESGIGFV